MTIARMRRATMIGVLVLAGVAAASGCDPRMAMYFLQPFDPQVPATGPDLRGKKVVILPHALSGAMMDAPGAEREIADKVAKAIRENIKKVQVVPSKKVSEWLEAHPDWTDPGDIGRDLDADAVIFLEFEQFQIQDPNSPGMFQGISSIRVSVVDLKYPEDEKGKPDETQPKESSVIYSQVAQSTFPTRGPVPVDSKVTPDTFRVKFTNVAATELSWHFVPHAPGDDIQDTRLDK